MTKRIATVERDGKRIVLEDGYKHIKAGDKVWATEPDGTPVEDTQGVEALGDAYEDDGLWSFKIESPPLKQSGE